MPDYQNGKIYTIRSHQTDDVYIGSTTQSLAVRMAGHRRDYKYYQDGKCPFMTSYEITKYDDCYIELLEECKCENKQQLHKREGELIRENDCVNKIIPGRTRVEHYQDNKQAIKEQVKQYYEANKEQIAEKRNQKFTCECGGKYTRIHKSRHIKSNKHQRYIEAQQ